MGNSGSDKPRRKRRTGCLVALGLLIVLIGGCVGYRVHFRARLNAELQAIRDAGYPVTLQELDAFYPQPAGENAADVLLKAFDLIVEPPAELDATLPYVGEGELPPRCDALPDEMKTAIADHLAANREALELLHKGARIKECRYPIDLTMGVAAILSPLGALRNGVRLLALEAVLRAEEGDGEAACRALLDCMGVGRSLAKEPLWISQLVRIVCYDLAADSLQRVLAHTSLTDSQLADLARALREAEDPELMTRAIAGERCHGMSIFDMVRRQPSLLWKSDAFRPRPVSHISTGLDHWVGRAVYVAFGLMDLDELTYLDLMGEAVRITELPLPEQFAPARTLKARVVEVPSSRLIASMITPAIGVESPARSTAQLRAARAALAVERYRLAHGMLPDKLADLVPDYMEGVPEDPFDGKPLRYKKLAKGYVVYSIGADGKDDGGSEEPPEGKRSPPDVTFTVER